MATTLWYATKTNGRFQAGRTYSKDQLGVLGRMAIQAGYLIPADPPPGTRVKVGDRVTRPRQARRSKGKSGGEASVQAGGGPDVLDDSGTQVSSDDDSGDQQAGEA